MEWLKNFLAENAAIVFSSLSGIVTVLVTVCVTVWQERRKDKYTEYQREIMERQLSCYMQIASILIPKEEKKLQIIELKNFLQSDNICKKEDKSKYVYPELFLYIKNFEKLESESVESIRKKNEASFENTFDKEYTRLSSNVSKTINYLKSELGYASNSLLSLSFRTRGKVVTCLGLCITIAIMTVYVAYYMYLAFSNNTLRAIVLSWFLGMLIIGGIIVTSIRRYFLKNSFDYWLRIANKKEQQNKESTKK